MSMTNPVRRARKSPSPQLSERARQPEECATRGKNGLPATSLRSSIVQRLQKANATHRTGRGDLRSDWI
jgi:hypothetical protein